MDYTIIICLDKVPPLFFNELISPTQYWPPVLSP